MSQGLHSAWQSGYLFPIASKRSVLFPLSNHIYSHNHLRRSSEVTNQPVVTVNMLHLLIHLLVIMDGFNVSNQADMFMYFCR